MDNKSQQNSILGIFIPTTEQGGTLNFGVDTVISRAAGGHSPQGPRSVNRGKAQRTSESDHMYVEPCPTTPKSDSKLSVYMR